MRIERAAPAGRSYSVARARRKGGRRKHGDQRMLRRRRGVSLVDVGEVVAVHGCVIAADGLRPVANRFSRLLRRRQHFATKLVELRKGRRRPTSRCRRCGHPPPRAWPRLRAVPLVPATNAADNTLITCKLTNSLHPASRQSTSAPENKKGAEMSRLLF